MTMADVHAECDQFARAEAKHATLTLQERGLGLVQHGADGRSVVILSSGLCVSFQTINENQNKGPAVVRPGRKALSGSGLRAHADVLGSLFENGLMSEEVSASA